MFTFNNTECQFYMKNGEFTSTGIELNDGQFRDVFLNVYYLSIDELPCINGIQEQYSIAECVQFLV